METDPLHATSLRRFLMSEKVVIVEEKKNTSLLAIIQNISIADFQGRRHFGHAQCNLTNVRSLTTKPSPFLLSRVSIRGKMLT